jgi:hypothetical protein
MSQQLADLHDPAISFGDRRAAYSTHSPAAHRANTRGGKAAALTLRMSEQLSVTAIRIRGGHSRLACRAGCLRLLLE